MIDTLEPRRYLSVSLDSAGWTVVSPASDTKVIYVSSSGNDSNNGLSAGAPVKTLPVAQGLVRDGYADWILLKRGDTFGSFGQWNKKGRSAQEPLYIGAYGTATTTTDNRPIIDAGTGYGIITYGNGTGSTARRIDNLVISSLNFIASTYNGSNGTGDTAAIRLLCQGANVTIEDVRAAGFRDNIVIGTDGNGGNTNTVIRRSEIMDSKNFTPVQNGVNTYSQGIYLSPSCIDCVIEENFIDNNGTKTGDDPYNEHNIYVRNGAVRTIVRNNVSSRASFYGLKFNAGGTADNNLFIKNSESVYLESAATITNNVITESIDMPAATWGVGINTQYAPSATISGNLITNSLSTGAGGIAGIQIFNNGTAFTGTVTDNIVYKWRNPLLNYLAAVSPVGALQIRNNQFQTVFGDTGATEQRSAATQDRFVYSGNIYSSGTKTSVNNVTASRVYKTQTEWRALTGNNTETYATPAFPDPTRTIARYQTEVIGGTATSDAYIAEGRAMNKANWNPKLTAINVNAWMRAGYIAASGADFNGDHVVNSVDFTNLITHFGRVGTATTGDANADGQVDTVDFALLIRAFGRPAGSLPAASVLPAASTTAASPFSNDAIGDSSLRDLLA